MGGQIATTYVRVRPNLTGFRAETEAGVKGAFSGIGKITATLFAVGGAAEGIKKIAEAAATDQAAVAVLDKTLQNAHASSTLFGKSIEEVIKQQARLRGFSDEDLFSSFVRLVSATHDSAKAYRDLGLAEDVARARHIGVAQAALAVSKAEQGVTTALQRLGIVIRPVTTNVDALKKAHDDATASGVQFSKQQNLSYAAALANAKAQDAILSRQNSINILQQRFGGTAATFANTASGAWARLQEQVHLFEVFLGNNVLPGLTHAGIEVGTFFQHLTQNQGLKSGLTQTLDLIKSTAATVAPPLELAAHAAGDLVGAIGVPELAAGAAAYKAVGLSADLAAAAKKKWAAASAAAAGAGARDTGGVSAETAAQLALTRALNASTAATIANAEALGANAAAREIDTQGGAVATDQMTLFDEALAANTADLAANTVATESLAAARVALAAATEASAAAEAAAVAPEVASAGALATLKAGALGLVGGPLGLVTLGVAALAAGIIYLKSHQDSWTKANRETSDSLNTLADALQHVTSVTAEQRANRQNLPSDRLNVRQARLGLEQAQQTLDTTKAAKGSLEYQQAVLGVAQAQQTLNDALRTLGDDQRHAGALSVQHANALRQVRTETDGTVTAIQHMIDKLPNFFSASKNIDLFGIAVDKLAAGTKRPQLRTNIQALTEYAAAVHRLPTTHEIRLILQSKDIEKTLATLTGQVFPEGFKQIRDEFGSGGEAAGSAFAQGVARGASSTALSVTAAVLNQEKAALTAIGAQQKALTDKTDQATSSLKTSIANLNTQLQSAILSQAQTVRDAVIQGRSNLDTFSTQIGDAIGNVLQRPLDVESRNLQAIQNRISFEQLRRELVLPRGQSLSEDPKKAVAQLEALQAKAKGPEKLALQQYVLQVRQAALQVEQDKVNVKKEAASRRVADLTDELKTGKITAAQFKSGFLGLLQSDHVSFKRAGALLGVAFRDGFAQSVHDLFAQATALKGVPAKYTSDLTSARIAEPLVLLRKSNDQIEKIQRNIERDHGKLLTRIATAAEKSAKLAAAAEKIQKKIDRQTSQDKNPGTQSKKNRNFAGKH